MLFCRAAYAALHVTYVCVVGRESVCVCVCVQVKNAKPGILSEDLRNGLGMAEGSPPPWLINMQRYGPPPSYPELKVMPHLRSQRATMIKSVEIAHQRKTKVEDTCTCNHLLSF